jgi:hypothetical protein
MTKIVEYCVIPHDVWMVVRFESERSEAGDSGGSTQRGEFQNEDTANEAAVLMAKAEGVKIRKHARKSLTKLAESMGAEVAD